MALRNYMETTIDRYFSKEDLLNISDVVTECEKTTSGEICVSVKEKTPFLLKKKHIKHLAVKEFYRLKINKTKDKTGILLFMQLDKKQFYILADEGINAKVKQERWDEISLKMQSIFKEGKFTEGMIFGVKEVAAILTEYFPIKEGDTNELSNKIEIN